MDMNVGVSLMTHLSLTQQSTEEHPDQLNNYTTHKRLVIIHMQQFVTQLLMQVVLATTH